MMRQCLMHGLLMASIVLAGSNPRLSTGTLMDLQPGSRGSGDSCRKEWANATIHTQPEFENLNLFRQRDTCPGNEHLCADGISCCYADENCVPGGCCQKPNIECGPDTCYDPKTENCCDNGKYCEKPYECAGGELCCRSGMSACEDEFCYDPEEETCCPGGKETCSLGFDCMSDGGCCESGSKRCGSTNCYDPDKSVCCTSEDGYDAWSCDASEKCCMKLQSCYDPVTEQCCESGACSASGSCCENECCDEDEKCGLDGYCTAAVASTPVWTPISTLGAEPTEGPDLDSNLGPDLGGLGLGRGQGTGGGLRERPGLLVLSLFIALWAGLVVI